MLGRYWQGTPRRTERKTAAIPLLTSVGARGFEPPTFCSQNLEEGFPDSANGSQVTEIITESEAAGVQPSQPFAENLKDFTTRLLPTSGEATVGEDAGGGLYGAHGAPNTAPACGTTPTLADLAVLHDGPNRLLRPDEVSRHLGISKATVYKMVKRGDLSHVRIADSIRVRPVDLAAFISSNRASEGTSDSPSPLSVQSADS